MTGRKHPNKAKLNHMYLDDDEGIVPMTCVLVFDWHIFIVNLDNLWPVGGYVHEMILAYEKRDAKNWCLVEDAIKTLIIFCVYVWLICAQENWFSKVGNP